MLISHEVPLSLLEKSYDINDYDYALVHLYDIYPQYRRFFIDSIKMGRKVILDNSLFELGEMFDHQKFADVIDETRPSEYIIPDTLEDMGSTVDSCEMWLKNYGDLPGVKIGVIQGKSMNECIECYKFMRDKVDKIAFPFHFSFFIDSEDSKYKQFMRGRVKLINSMLDMGIIDKNIPHHLLGCSLPQEFIYYRDFNWIETVDTSNPIVHAIKNIRYSDYGLNDKVSIKLVDLFNTDINSIDSDILFHNIKKFREFCGVI